MSFDKNYPNRKDHREPSRKASRGCRNHGSCGYCADNRQYSNVKRQPKVEEVCQHRNSYYCGDTNPPSYKCNDCGVIFFRGHNGR